MKFSQLLIALAVGLVIFTGLYMSENARRVKVQEVKNPFEETVELPEILILDDTSKANVVFSEDRELWQFFPNSYTDFTEDQRRIVDGPVFVSFNFITEASLKASRNFQTDGFDPDTFRPTIAQVQIENLAINAPGASFFIDRSAKAGLTRIYAYDHAIDVWFPGASQPFVLPSRRQVTINDKVIDRLGKLYYTKLKKDLRLKPFDVSDNAFFEQALVIRKEKLEAIKNFAQNIPNTWYWFDPGSVMGQFTGFIKYLQKDYALGISQSMRKRYDFDSLVSAFLSAHHRYLNNDKAGATKQIDKFLETLGSHDWQRFFIENPQFSPRWEFLGQNQRIWLHHAFQDDPEYVFAPVWFASASANSLADVEKAIFEVEEMMTNQFITKAKQGLGNLADSFNKVKFSDTDSQRVTRVRRLLNELIEEEIALQTETILGLLRNMIEAEVNLYADSDPNREEIVLENAQDILGFLKIFIEDRSAGKINQILVNSYSFLKIDQIESTLGRAIFNQAEKETIKLVQFVRAEELSEADLLQIQQDKSLRDLIDERFAALEDDKVEQQETIYSADKIDTKEELEVFLQKAQVLVSGLRIELKSSTSNPTFVFSGAYYGDNPLSGTFRIDSQIFNLISLGDNRETYVDPKVLSSILRRIEKDIEEARIAKELETQYTGPSNNTPLAILQRKLVRDTFEQEGLRVGRDDVLIVSNDYNEFEVSNAFMGKEYRLKFTYFQKEEYVTNLVVEYVRNRFEFGDQVIARKGIQDFVTTAVLERFKSGDTDPGQ